MTALLLVVLTGLLVSFLCSILEAVLLSMTHSYVALMHDRGERAGALLLRMRSNIDEPIAAILTLNTIAHTVGAAVGGAYALRLFGDKWIALFSAALTLAILVFSEILPKTIGATYWQQLGVPTAYVLRALTLLLRPILVPLAWFNRLITPRRGGAPTVSRAELEILAEVGRREGTLDEDEWRVVSNVINLEHVRVSEVMTPRTRVAAIDVDDGVQGARAAFRDHGHRRYPVFDGTIDEVLGIVTVGDILRAEDDGVDELRPLLRPARFVPETKSVEELIREMRRERLSLAIVIDEFGGTAGLVTLEDLLEEIIGEVRDEHDPDFESIRAERDGSFLIAGTVAIDEVNERFLLDLTDEEHITIAGFLISRLGRLGRTGDVIDIRGGRLEIVATEGRRIAFIRFTPGRAVAQPD
jgi:CBS domain containing-hemolysin-like protein